MSSPVAAPKRGCASRISYQTVKMVNIEDPCLGMLHYGLTVAIFIYIVVVQVVYKTGYITFEPPTGSVRMSLQAPVVDLCDPTKPGCQYNFTDASTLPYCQQYTGGKAHPGVGRQLVCKDMDSFNAVWPVTGGSPFFVATRVEEANQTLVCETPTAASEVCEQTYAFSCDKSFDVDPDCKDFATEVYYLADIESFTLLVDHTVQSPTVPDLKGDAANMNGLLKQCDGKLVKPAQTPMGQDVFTIKQLLDAAPSPDGHGCGVSLDNPSTVAADAATRSIRYDGMVLQLTITYENVKHWTGQQDAISYTYSVQLIAGAKSKVLEQIFVSYPDQRVMRNNHGIKINTMQTGELGTFDITTLVIQLTTSLALLKLTTTVVDILAVSVLPHKAQYKNAKVDEVEVGEGDSVVVKNKQVSFSYGTVNDGAAAAAAASAAAVVRTAHLSPQSARSDGSLDTPLI